MHTTIRSSGQGRQIVSAISGVVLASYTIGDAAGRTAAEETARSNYNTELTALTNGNWIGGNPANATIEALREAWGRKAAAASDAAEFSALYARIVAQLIADEYITE